MPISKEKTNNLLWKVLTACWYVTIISFVFYEYLLPVELPIGGHMFLYRVAVPVTFALFVAWIVRYKYPVFKRPTKVEFWFFVLVGTMALYTVASVFWSLDVKRWFSKGSTIAYSLCFTTMFLILCRDKKVFRNTMVVAVGILGFCALGGFAEIFVGQFFDTPYGGDVAFTFFDHGLYAPIFCFYNTNSLAVSTFWGLLLGIMFLFEKWDDMVPKKRKWWNLLLVIGVALCYFLYMAGSARTGVICIEILLGALAVWYLLRHKTGLVAVAVLLLFFWFVYIGVNYAYLTRDPTPTEPTVSTVTTTPSESNPNGDTVPGQTESSPDGDTVPGPTESSPDGDTVPDSTPSEPTEPVSDGSHGIASREESDAIRVNLLLNGYDMLNKSNWLGIGVGNAEPRMREYSNVKGILSLHCFVAELFVEYGIFAIIPFAALLITLFINWIALLRKSFLCRDRRLFANTLFQLVTAITFPLASSANSSSWGIMAMWGYLAYLLVDISNKNRELLTLSKDIS